MSSLSVLQRERRTELKREREKLLHLPLLGELRSDGFQGDQQDMLDIVHYLAQIELANSQSSSTTPSQAPKKQKHQSPTPAALKKQSDSEYSIWLKKVKAVIEQGNDLTKKGSVFSIDVQTPFYDSLLSTQDSLIAQASKLRLSQQSTTRFPPLPLQITQKIQSTLSQPPATPIIEKFNIQIKTSDLMTLVGRNWLNDEVLNFYGNLIMERSRDTGGVWPKVHFFNTFFYKNLETVGYSSVKKWTKRAKVNLFEMDYVIVPVHLSVHWCCAVIDVQRKKLEYYDSMYGDNYRCFELLKDYLVKECKDKLNKELDVDEWEENIRKDIPTQENGYDCGVFTLMFAESVSRGVTEEFEFRQSDMGYLRKRIIYEILSGKLCVGRDGSICF